MKRRALSIVAGLIVLALLPGSALAVSSIDQQNSNVSYDWGGSATHTYAQSFTAATPGHLTGVNLRVYAGTVATTVDVSIEATDVSGYPTGAALTTGSGSVTTTDAWVNVNLTPYVIASGVKYALVFTLQGQAGGTWNILGAITNPYSGGEALDPNAGWHGLQDVDTSDFAFQTLVEALIVNPCASPTATPTPTPTPQVPNVVAVAPAAAVTASACTTLPPTSTGSGGSSNGSSGPLLAILMSMAFAGLGLAAVEQQRRAARR